MSVLYGIIGVLFVLFWVIVTLCFSGVGVLVFYMALSFVVKMLPYIFLVVVLALLYKVFFG